MIKKPIVVYWGVNTTDTGFAEGIRAEEPIPILNKFFKTNESSKKANIHRCPSVQDEFHNVYGIKSYYDYRLDISSDNRITTSDHNDMFFENHVHIRHERLMTFMTNHVFFAPYEKSLLLSQIAPTLEDNEIANKVIMVQGKFDIAKYFRTMDFGFIFKKHTSSILFSIDEIMFYIRFHTDRPIVFKRFFWDKQINDYYDPLMASKSHKYPRRWPLTFYYNLFDKFQFKKKIVKLIEDNLTKP